MFISRSVATWMRARLSDNQRFTVLCIVCGLLCGLVAVAFHLVIHALFEGVLKLAESQSIEGFILILLLAPTLGGLIVGFGIKFVSPAAAGSGIPQTKAAYFNKGGKISSHDGFWRFILGSLYVGLGNSLGREGPTVHVSASIGSRLGRWAFKDPRRKQAMVPVGVAGGIAAAFNAPIAAIMFVFEELMDSFAIKALGGIAIAVVIAAATSRMILGESPIVQAHLFADYETSLWMLVAVPLGVFSGLFGTAFTSSVLKLRQAFKVRTFFPVWLRPAAGGLMVGCLGLTGWFVTGLLGQQSHDVFSVGYDSLELAFEAKLVAGVLATLLILKGLAVVINYATGGSGGLFSPTLFLGGMIGGLAGIGLSAFNASTPLPGWPGDQEVIGGCVLLGMGALFGAVIRNPLTSLIMIFEMTGTYSLILPLMGGNLIAWAIADRLQSIPIYNALLLQDGITLKRMPGYRGSQDYTKLPVSAIMTHDVHCLGEEQTVSGVRAELRECQWNFHGYPVLSAEGELRGIVTRSELRLASPDVTIGQLIAKQELLSVDAQATICKTANQMIARDIQQVPVTSPVNPKKLVGLLTLNDISRQQNAAEEL